RTERQYFDVETFTVDEVAIEVPGVDLDPVPFSYSSSTDGTVEAELVAPSNPLGCTDAHWDGVEATGKIAVVSRGECPFADKTVAAAEVGAAAVIVYNNTTGALNGTLGNPIEGSAPGV